MLVVCVFSTQVTFLHTKLVSAISLMTKLCSSPFCIESAKLSSNYVLCSCYILHCEVPVNSCQEVLDKLRDEVRGLALGGRGSIKGGSRLLIVIRVCG